MTPPAALDGEFRALLRPEPASVPEARRLVKATLKAWGYESLVDDAVLVVSELVTNTVLHAGTDTELVVRRLDDGIRIEVADTDDTLPLAKDYGPDAATGRGLSLVALIAADWGVDVRPGGKALWVDLSARSAGTPRTPWPVDLSTWATLDTERHQRPTAHVPAHPAQGELVEIHLLGLPVDLQHRSAQHHDDLVREFQLMDARPAAHEIPARMVNLSAELTSRYGSFNESSEAELAAARERGDAHIDITYLLPPDAAEAAEHLGRLLDEADAYCRAGADLLTLATPDDLVAFRRWLLEEISAQIAGRPPRPWSNPKQTA